MPKVSIIMPSLNVGKYIDECINSVVSQTLKDIEILCIDAGSTDGTIDILREYEKKYGNVHVIISDKKSYGYQMNLGISIAKGDYIGIVETDDYIDSRMYECLWNEAEKKHADYAKGISKGFLDCGENLRFEHDIIPCRQLKEHACVECHPCDMPLLFWTDNFLWNGIYRADFMKNIRFNETHGAAFQDIGALFQIISSAKKAVYVKQLVYYYRRSNSEASSYNKQSFNYVATEYTAINKKISLMSDDWKKMYYIKLMGIFLDRFDYMGRSGEYWTESETGIKQIFQLLQDGIKKRLFSAIEFQTTTGYDVNYIKKVNKVLLDFKAYYEDVKISYCNEKKNIALLDQFVEGKEIIIFGSGNYGRFLGYYLLKKQYDLVAFCDNNTDLFGKKIYNISIIPLNFIKKSILDRGVFIIANKKCADEIEGQLLQSGIDNERIMKYTGSNSIFLLM